MKRCIALLLLMLLISCSHRVTFVSPDDKQSFFGQYSRSERSIEVTLPSGEAFIGKYIPFTNTTITSGSLFEKSPLLDGAMTTLDGASSGYAFLYGDEGTTMEIIFQYNGKHGFGTAKTNKGEEYRIIF